MIRINLLAVEKPVTRARSFNFDLAAKVGPLGATLVLVGAVAYVGLDYLALTREDAALYAELASVRAEKQRLAPILLEVARFDERKKELQQRVTLIEELRTNQVGPVHMLDQISRSLPDRLWLTEMKQTGDDVQLDGRTSSLSALADLVANLEASGYFTRPVDILSSEEERANDKDLIKFAIKATFALPGARKPAAPEAPKKRGAAGTKRLAQ